MPFADLTDVRMYYQVSGRGAPLLLIPGLGTTSQVWDPIAADLNKHFSVIYVDNRGIGRSQSLRHARTVRDYSSDLIELLEHLQVDQAHVMGLSLGGIVALRFALDHPQIVERLVLVSCTHSFTPYLREIARLVGQTLRSVPKSVFARTMEVLGAGPLFLDANPQRIDERIELMRQMRLSGRAILRQLRALAASQVDVGQYSIQAPTLVVAGEFDALIPHCYARLTAQMIDDSRFVLIPHCGHNPFLDCPEIVLPTIVGFLQTERLPQDMKLVEPKQRTEDRMVADAAMPPLEASPAT